MPPYSSDALCWIIWRHFFDLIWNFHTIWKHFQNLKNTFKTFSLYTYYSSAGYPAIFGKTRRIIRSNFRHSAKKFGSGPTLMKYIHIYTYISMTMVVKLYSENVIAKPCFSMIYIYICTFYIGNFMWKLKEGFRWCMFRGIFLHYFLCNFFRIDLFGDIYAQCYRYFSRQLCDEKKTWPRNVKKACMLLTSRQKSARF